MNVRMAKEKDIQTISDLLLQVDLVHHNGRPDIFKVGRKYSLEQIKELLTDKNKPILVCVNDEDSVLGYCFCVYQQSKDSAVLTDVKSLYIDDLCVDESLRGRHIGKTLLNSAIELAKENGCHNVTLNVWTCNDSALKFYQACGFVPQKIVMEKII